MLSVEQKTGVRVKIPLADGYIMLTQRNFYSDSSFFKL